MDFTNAKDIIENLLKLLNGRKVKTKRLPDIALVLGKTRSGISKDRVKKKILSKLPENGIKIILPNGTSAPIQNLVSIIVDCIFDEIHENARIDVTIPSNGVQIIGQATPTGQVTGTNLLPTMNGIGIIV